MRAGEAAAGGETGEAAAERAPGPKRKHHRSWKRWLANLMIITGVLVLTYPLSTWAYTWWEQRGLREQVEQANSLMTAPVRAEDLVPATTTTTLTATPDPMAAALAKAEAERKALQAAFRAAADAFQAQVAGKTGEPIGKILIPSIGLDVIMVEGAGTLDLREGPGHWPETPFPGQGGNFVVSGHRTTYGAPFRKFDKVQVGDTIDVILPYAAARYSVIRVIIVYPDEVDEVAQRGWEQVSLAACHPLYSARQRIVVQGDLIGFKLADEVTSPR